MTPGTAYKEFLRNVKSCCIDKIKYNQVLADRSKVPRRKTLTYTEYNREVFGCKCQDMIFAVMAERLNRARDEFPDHTVEYTVHDENNSLLVSIVTPLMHRVHQQIDESGELVFMNYSSIVEEYNLRVFYMMTHSVIGALELGILITSDEKVHTLIKGCQQLKGCPLVTIIFMVEMNSTRHYFTSRQI